MERTKVREVEFRGYSIKYKRWVYGYLYTWYSDASDKVVYNIIYDDFHLVRDGISYGWNGFEVVPESIGQLTELHDNTQWVELTEEEKKFYENGDITKDNWKGKKIYEGDIVEFRSVFHDYDDVGVVKWSENGFYIVGDRDKDVLLHPYNTKFMKVIGNIYEKQIRNRKKNIER